jgi:hypothetical protein
MRRQEYSFDKDDSFKSDDSVGKARGLIASLQHYRADQDPKVYLTALDAIEFLLERYAREQ